jgi:hypothetical protein
MADLLGHAVPEAPLLLTVGIVDEVEPLDAGVLPVVEKVLEHVADQDRPAGIVLLDPVGLELVGRRILPVLGPISCRMGMRLAGPMLRPHGERIRPSSM